jgi:PhoH-like ATPase
VLDTNVLIHDPNALPEPRSTMSPSRMTVLEEPDKLKTGKQTIAAECRQAIRLIDQDLARRSPNDVEQGVPIHATRAGPKASCPS